MNYVLSNKYRNIIIYITLFVILIGSLLYLYSIYQPFYETLNKFSILVFIFCILLINIIIIEYFKKLKLIKKIDRLSLDLIEKDNITSKFNKELEYNNQEIIELIFSVTHDLKAPLRSIQGYAKAINDDYSGVLDINGVKMLHRINFSVLKMERLIQDLLLYNKIGQKELRLINLDLKVLINDVLRENKENIIKHNISFELILPFRCVYGSMLILDKIISNLIGNAIKFSMNTSMPKIKIWSEHTLDFVRLSIKDNGIGIEEKNFEKIFKVFERLHSDEQYPGTGIGLSIVKKGIERMNGRFGVESVLSEYSIFWIELPKCSSLNS